MKQQKSIWEPDTEVQEIFGKKIGILGTGNIAQETAKRLKVFGASVSGINRSGRNPSSFFDDVAAAGNKEALYSLYRSCDVIISTLPEKEETFHMLNESAFAWMKKDVVLINRSRGRVVDEKDLIHRLSQGFFRGVALDVFEEKPMKDRGLVIRAHDFGPFWIKLVSQAKFTTMGIHPIPGIPESDFRSLESLLADMKHPFFQENASIDRDSRFALNDTRIEGNIRGYSCNGKILNGIFHG